MTELQFYPPPPDAMAAMTAIPGLRVAPGMLITQQGPAGDLGPESAGAILILQATFADPDGAQRFWEAAVPLMAMLAEAPGFVRRFSFADGPSIYLIALWRTAADAHAFGASPEHRAAVRGLFQGRWQYSHFSAIWEMTTNHDRIVFCDRCQGITPASERMCRACGTELADVFRAEAPAGR